MNKYIINEMAKNQIYAFDCLSFHLNLINAIHAIHTEVAYVAHVLWLQSYLNERRRLQEAHEW